MLCCIVQLLGNICTVKLNYSTGEQVQSRAGGGDSTKLVIVRNSVLVTCLHVNITTHVQLRAEQGPLPGRNVGYDLGRV